MRGGESSYRWHYDSNSATGVIFVNTIPIEDGGSLEALFEGQDYTIPSNQGELVVFDGRRLPHTVAPLSKLGMLRHSIALTYYLADDSAPRPSDVSQHTYGSTTSDERRNSSV